MSAASVKQRFDSLCQWAGSLWYVKYIVVVVLGVIMVGFGGENSLRAHRDYEQCISELKQEIAALTEQFQRDQQQLRLLQTDPKTVERVARERYFMRRSNEDVFVLEDEL